eukprot:gb/GEZJ01003516.1/.p1 GENE.gb/GEZJ01003516.1/~~gb/GEZJ01003516.1/.p1  ORF type:complete len:698 (+),score=133.72 gb/GEZJ01003516.1/:3527-5620(+)
MSEEFPYGSVVWAKIPSFPWWPAKVIKPQPAHLRQLDVNKLRKTQYVVVFYNDNEQIGLIANFNMQPFRNRSLHDRAQREKTGLKTRLLKAIEFAEEDLKSLDGGAHTGDLPAEAMKLGDGDSPRSNTSKRSHALTNHGDRVKSEKKSRADSAVFDRKSSSSLGKRKSSHRKKVKTDPMQDFIVEEGEKVNAEESDVGGGHEVLMNTNEKARHRRKKPKLENRQFRETGTGKRHLSEWKSENKLKSIRSEHVIPSQRVDAKGNEIHPIKSGATKQGMPRENSESMADLPSSRPPSLSEEAWKSMMRDTENVDKISKQARFKVLMEHLRAIRESNVKQWREGLENAAESVIIRKESILLKALFPALYSGRKLVRWVAAGNRKTPETVELFNKLEKDAIERALAVQKVYFELAPEYLISAGSKLREVQKNLADISRAASRCFRDILILWADIQAPGPLKECIPEGIDFMESDVLFDDSNSPEKIREEATGEAEQRKKSHDSVGSHSPGDSFDSESRLVQEEQTNGTDEEEANHSPGNSKKRKNEALDGENETKRMRSRTSEDSQHDSSASDAKEKKVEKSPSSEVGKRKDRWKGFSRDKFIQVMKAQLRPLAKVADENEQLAVIEVLEERLSGLYDPCTSGYYKTGLLMTHGIQKLVKRHKQFKTDETNSDDEAGGPNLLMDALEHPENVSTLADFILK